MKSATLFVVFCALSMAVMVAVGPALAAPICESFESGYSLGSTVGAHANWYDGGSGPVVTSGAGVSSSVGLAPASAIFTWTAHPFDWNDADFTGVMVQMDFQTDGSGHLDDDRIGWMITNNSTSSSNIFGLQCDPGGSGYCIEGYWDGVTADKRPHIVDLPALSANAWYRFRAVITKLTATSASIDVILITLNSSGDSVGVAASGSIANTATLGDDEPNAKYFTAATIWPAFKNYTSAGANADNACFEVFTTPPVDNWTAYNDCVYQSSNNYIGADVTTFGVGSGFTGSTSGELKDQATGGRTEATATLTESGGVVWQPSDAGGGHDTQAGTDAYNTFNGLADMKGVIYYGSVGWYVDLTFSGLDPAKRYTFATSAARSNVSYSDRMTVYTISGTDAATNGSTSGVEVLSPTSVRFVTGDNDAAGYVARWTDIDPGSDGGFTVRAESDASSPEGRKAYSFDVFMLQEYDPGALQYSLTVNTVGNGSVDLDPPGGLYDPDTEVELTANPDLNWAFDGWSGDLTGAANPDTITMDGHKTVTATFIDTTKYTLTVNVVGNGSVILDPPTGPYLTGTKVELTADADPGWYFSGWSGDLTGSTSPDTITMDANKNVTATFNELQVLNPGDVIISAVQSWNAVGTQDPAEFVELFNTTDQTISLANMELISRTDNDASGSLDTDWELADEFPDLTGKEIGPYSFFLIAESGVAAPSSVHDVEVDMDLATGEGGYLERAIGLQLIIDGQHMDHFLYGRHDGSDTGANPDGDVAWSAFPRYEVIRNTLGTTSFQEGLISRQTAEDLHAGYDALGYYTDEDVLGDGYPNGIWYCPHDNTNDSYQARNSLSAAVPPPLPPQTLTVHVVGSGQVFLNPPGGTYEQGSEVILTAVPDLGSFFDSWSGDLTGAANPDTIQMSEDKDVTATFPVNPNTIILDCEDFESGFATGSTVGTHADWFDGGGGPVVTAGNGVAGSIGLAPANNIFIWTVWKFWWTAGGLQYVNFQMDFQTDGSGYLDDDRIGWMITDDDVGSSNIFGIQCDPGGSGYCIEGYWDGVSAADKRPHIVDLPALSADAWYRLRGRVDKLGSEAAGVEVWLFELDGAGDPAALVAHGSIANTADLGDDAPHSKYFTGPIWPAFKNYTAAGAAADNACFELVLIQPTAIDLAAFDAVAGDGQVTLTWRTAAEVSSHSFHIYRNGVRLATVPALGQAHDYILVDRRVTNGQSYSYQLSDVDAGGRETMHPVICTVTPTALPIAYSLSQNYPNPFNPSTEITYSLPRQTHVTLKIYNLLGQELATLVDEPKEAGQHSVSWDAFGNASGIYFYRLETEEFSATRKMVFMQ